MDLQHYMAEEQALVDAALDRWVPSETTPPATLHRAIRYSLFAGGKRIRPLLCLAAARAVNAAVQGAERRLYARNDPYLFVDP
jgi:geranylgeranyl diphosphate synthase, type II